MPPDGFFGIHIFVKFNFVWGFVLDPAGGAYDAPPDPLVYKFCVHDLTHHVASVLADWLAGYICAVYQHAIWA